MWSGGLRGCNLGLWLEGVWVVGGRVVVGGFQNHWNGKMGLPLVMEFLLVLSLQCPEHHFLPHDSLSNKYTLRREAQQPVSELTLKKR